MKHETDTAAAAGAAASAAASRETTVKTVVKPGAAAEAAAPAAASVSIVFSFFILIFHFSFLICIFHFNFDFLIYFCHRWYSAWHGLKVAQPPARFSFAELFSGIFDVLICCSEADDVPQLKTAPKKFEQSGFDFVKALNE